MVIKHGAHYLHFPSLTNPLPTNAIQLSATQGWHFVEFYQCKDHGIQTLPLSHKVFAVAPYVSTSMDDDLFEMPACPIT
jgi:hypothetical protein